MSTEGLKKLVLEKAREEATELLERARKRAEEIRSSARRQAERSASEIVARARAEAEASGSRARSALSRELGMRALEGRNRILDEAFERAARAFKEAPPEELQRLYRSELEGLELSGAVVKVPVGRASEMSSILEGRARVEEDPSIDAGYIVLREDFRLDRTLQARLAEARELLKTELARMLFGGS